MTRHNRFAMAVLALTVIAVAGAGSSLAGEPQRHVVGQSEIQGLIDQQIGQADADRQAIRTMLQREDVRRIAGSAGLDIARVSAAAGALSGDALTTLAAQARDVNASLVGGDSTVVLSATTIIIILLIIILLAD